ncbi:hypothetical protein D7V91_08660 [bacterium 1xD42-67]|nr:hypothetical protein D7V91_08660 [bacterium 1xD42-67]
MEKQKDDHAEKIAKIVETAMALPEEMQDILCWAMEDYPALEEMARKSDMTLEQIEREMLKALLEEDCKTLVRLYITKSVKESKENEEI